MKRAGYATGTLAVVGLIAFWYFDGHLPAPMGPVPFALTSDLTEAMQAVDSRGQVNLTKLQAHRVALEAFITTLASTPTDHFATPEEGLVFWLNAYHALTLQTLLDGNDGWWRSWPIGGRRLTRAALARHHLRDLGDPRIALSLCDGSRGGPRLDGAAFDTVMLEAQLTDAARRFIGRADVVHLNGKTVELSARLVEHEADLLAALPEGNRHILQFIWAFLPETCDGARPGCETRAALDSACGRTLTGCAIQVMAPDETQATTR